MLALVPVLATLRLATEALSINFRRVISYTALVAVQPQAASFASFGSGGTCKHSSAVAEPFFDLDSSSLPSLS